jgi:cytochrome oxidase Cu insertion factor (SCO1/SenC/PrrC family)
MSSVIDPDLRRRNFRTVFALAALFMLPLLLSFWLYYGWQWRPQGMTNHGELIQPLRPLPQLALRDAAGAAQSHIFEGHWTLVYVGNGACDADCRTTLIFMRQTRLSLNNEMTRVQRVFLATADCCDRAYLAGAHPGLRVLDASQAGAQPLLAQFPAAEASGRARELYIVDPLGNLMMRYDARLPPQGLLEDLKRLLQLSHIG